MTDELEGGVDFRLLALRRYYVEGLHHSSLRPKETKEDLKS